MIHTPQSSSILEVGYDREQREIWVTFRPSGTYAYERCPASLWDALRAAESKGRFVNEAVKAGDRPFRKISPRELDGR